MCLDAVRNKPFPEEKEQIGWKAFKQVRNPRTWKPRYGMYRFAVRSVLGILRLGETYVSKDNIEIGSGWYQNGKPYPVGFHIYLNKPRNLKGDLVLVKVHFTNVVARGDQNGRKMVVAKEITLLEESKGRRVQENAFD